MLDSKKVYLPCVFLCLLLATPLPSHAVWVCEESASLSMLVSQSWGVWEVLVDPEATQAFSISLKFDKQLQFKGVEAVQPYELDRDKPWELRGNVLQSVRGSTPRPKSGAGHLFKAYFVQVNPSAKGPFTFTAFAGPRDFLTVMETDTGATWTIQAEDIAPVSVTVGSGAEGSESIACVPGFPSAASSSRGPASGQDQNPNAK